MLFAYEKGIKILASNFIIMYNTAIFTIANNKFISFVSNDMLVRISPIPYRLNIPIVIVIIKVPICKLYIFWVNILDINSTTVIKDIDIKDWIISLIKTMFFIPYGEIINCSIVPILASFTTILLVWEKEDNTSHNIAYINIKVR